MKRIQFISPDSPIPYADVVKRLRHHIQETYGDRPTNVVADMMGVSKTVLYEVLGGKRVPTPYLLAVIGLRRRKAYVFEAQR